MLKGKSVILVDDGIATGMTVRAAIEYIGQHEPGHLVLAVPVCAATAEGAPLRGRRSGKPQDTLEPWPSATGTRTSSRCPMRRSSCSRSRAAEWEAEESDNWRGSSGEPHE